MRSRTEAVIRETGREPDEARLNGRAGLQESEVRTMTAKEGFQFEQDMLPVWEGDTVYHESVAFYPEPESGKIAPAPLLYRPEKILSVFSSDFSRKYREGEDYILDGGRIRLTEESEIPVWEYDEFYRKEPDTIPISSAAAPGRYIRVEGSGIYASRQAAVTYRKCGDSVWSGPVPEYCGGRLWRVTEKLTKKQPITIVYYGDSIMTGCDASGKYGRSPNMPIFPDLVTQSLKKHYGLEEISAFNTAVGGKTSQWGLEELKERVIDKRPDLVVVGFGMNDSGSVDEYELNNRLIAERTREICPDTEFLFVSTTLPNQDCVGWCRLQPEYQKGLEHLVNTMPGTALVRMTDMHRYLLSAKRFWDMTGNGVNHPNDFLARVYAQTIAAALIK